MRILSIILNLYKNTVFDGTVTIGPEKSCTLQIFWQKYVAIKRNKWIWTVRYVRYEIETIHNDTHNKLMERGIPGVRLFWGGVGAETENTTAKWKWDEMRIWADLCQSAKLSGIHVCGRESNLFAPVTKHKLPTNGLCVYRVCYIVHWENG